MTWAGGWTAPRHACVFSMTLSRAHRRLVVEYIAALDVNRDLRVSLAHFWASVVGVELTTRELAIVRWGGWRSGYVPDKH